MDGIIPAYVLHEFPVWLGLVVVMGLISAGLSTLEGLIQALATTITADLVAPLAGRLLAGRRTRRRERALLLAVSRVVHRAAGRRRDLPVAGPAAAPQAERGHLRPERRLRLLLGGLRAHPLRHVHPAHAPAGGRGRRA